MSMKSILRLMGALVVATGATTSVIACGTGAETPTNPYLDSKYAVLLGWYSDENTSIINEKLVFNELGACFISGDSTNIIKEHLFKEKLLIEGSVADKFKATNVDAALFLADLGFKSGNQDQDYDKIEVEKIDNLVATIKTAYPGNVSVEGTTDFKVDDGACQIDIMTNKSAGSVVKSYTIKTKAANLNIANVITTTLIKNKDDLKLTAAQGFQAGKSTSGFKLEFTDALNQTKFDSLLKVLNNPAVTMHFFLSPSGNEEITTFEENKPTFLELHLDTVVLSRIALDSPVAP